MYPRLKEGVSLYLVPDARTGKDHNIIETKIGAKFEVSMDVLDEVAEADGSHPLNLSDSCLRKLEKVGVLTTSRFVFGGLMNTFILFPIGSRAEKVRPLCRDLNQSMPLVSLLLLMIGIIVSVFDKVWESRVLVLDNYGEGVWFYIISIAALFILSITLHEMGHMIAAIAYGFQVSDLGVLLFVIFPIGGYVRYQDKKDATRNQQRQVALAGIEINALLVGLFLIFSMAETPFDLPLQLAAEFNAVLILVNLIPGLGSDGEAILSTLIGVKSIETMADDFLRSKKKRKKLLASGIGGKAAFAFLVFIRLCSFILLILMVWDIICFATDLVPWIFSVI